MSKNSSLDDEIGASLLKQLPQECQNKIYKDFLFKDFLKTFSHFF